MNNLSVGFYCGDLRSIYMADIMSRRFCVNVHNLEAKKLDKCNIINTPEELFYKSDIIVSPVSLFINNDDAVNDFCRHVKHKNYIFGGCFPDKLTTYFKDNDIKYHDYMNNENFVLYNTISTAEGVLSIAISETDINLSECNVLILGYGRCSKMLARKFKHLCKKLCISARKDSDIFTARLNGIESFELSDLSNNINKFNIIINTVPSMILNKNVLRNVETDSLIIDIASKPGGTDFEYCEKNKLKAIHALSLPGKYAPRSTAQFLCKMLLKELGM